MSTTKMPVKIILGTHTIGFKAEIPGTIHFEAEQDVAQVLDIVYDHGFRNIDTSANYVGSELYLGRAGAPSRFKIDTKVKSGQPGDLESSKVAASIERSLQDLGVSSVETMYLHVPDRQTDLEETAAAMNEAFLRGSFKRFGLSNYTTSEVEQFLNICEHQGFVKPTVYQGHYNAIVRGSEKELFPLLRKHNMSFVAYSPAAGGFFSNSATTTARWSDDNPIGKLYQSMYSDAAVQASRSTVQAAAAKYNITGHTAALRWAAYHSILDGAHGDGIIFSVSSIAQLEQTLHAFTAGPLPSELADAISVVWSTVEGKGPLWHL